MRLGFLTTLLLIVEFCLDTGGGQTYHFRVNLRFGSDTEGRFESPTEVSKDQTWQNRAAAARPSLSAVLIARYG